MKYYKQARTFLPEILAPGTGLSPTTDKSVVPTNNVYTIQDVLDGRKYTLPGGGGDWSSGEDVSKSYNSYHDFETENNTFTGVDYNIHYDLIDAVLSWCDCESAQECKEVLQNLEQTKGIFLGEFVKAITKINNISSEMEKIAESIGNMSLLSKLRDIPRMTLKFVATNQSLYV